MSSDTHFGLTGLATMGANLARNVAHHDIPVVVHNRTTSRMTTFVDEHGSEGPISGQESVADWVNALQRPRVLMSMVQAGPATDAVIDEIAPNLDKGDVLIDGGNANFRDTQRRHAKLQEQGIHFLGVGVSGGEEGALKGPSIMPGGDEAPYDESVKPIFEAIAAQVDGTPCVTYVGADGAGHFVKMVHNGIEYGVMAAYAEGLNILRNANVGTRTHVNDAETTPLRDPAFYQYEMNLPEITEVWRRGSVIGSWLLDLTAGALLKDPQLAAYDGRVSDSGEGRWTLEAAIDEAVPAHVLSAALFERFTSRSEAGFANQLLSAMRHEFGGHVETSAAGPK
jgi:6-phosphogluconate dehydrogenase